MEHYYQTEDLVEPMYWQQVIRSHRESEKMGDFDLILCGKQTTDGDTAQVGSEVSEWLNIPSVSNVKKISKVESDAITIEMDLPEELEIAKVQYPCLLSVDKDIFQPRLPSYVKKYTQTVKLKYIP